MSATGADPQAERTQLREESRTWGLIRRTLPLGRSAGSMFYLISVGLIASWIVAVFFGVGLFFLMPRSAKLEPGLKPGGTSFDASLWLTQATSRLDRLSNLPPPAPAQPMGDDAVKVNPHQMPAEATIAHTAGRPPEPAPGLNRGQPLTVELGTISAAIGEAAPTPAPQSQLSTAPKPRGASQSFHSPSRKPIERRPSNTRPAQRHAPVSAIEDALKKHSHLLK
jgi:hypothetical protein